jgi:phospho-N-acetylmuramoyl-pentapeptide-transferase
MTPDFFGAAGVLLLAMLLGITCSEIALRLIANHSGGRHTVREDVPATHREKAGTPSMGGLGMIPAMLLAAMVACVLAPDESSRLVLVICGAVLFAMIGFWDDYAKLRGGGSKGVLARYRIMLELGLGLFFAWLLARETPQAGLAGGLGFGVMPIEVRVLLGGLVIVASANAVNLTDGLDGLAAGTSAIAGLALAVVCWVTGSPGLALCALCITGAAAGFLWLNFKPAAIWMGDVGSLGLGAALGLVAVAAGVEWTYALIGGVFVMEALSVIMQVGYFKATDGRRLFPMTPIHHSFELLGWPETKIVTRFWLVGAILGLLGVLVAAGMAG